MEHLKQRLAQSDKRFAHVKNLHKQYKAVDEELRLALNDGIGAEFELLKSLLGQASPNLQRKVCTAFVDGIRKIDATFAAPKRAVATHNAHTAAFTKRHSPSITARKRSARRRARNRLADSGNDGNDTP